MRCPAWAFLAGLALLGAGPGKALAASAVLFGTVRDENGDGLPGVRAQVLLDGYPLVSTRSDSLGAYRLVFPWIATVDSTVVVWWTAEETELVPAVAMLRESKAAQRLGLWDATIPRVAAPAESVYDPVLCTRGRAGRRSAAADTTGSAAGPGSRPESAPARKN
jgi:hypothetical protein